MPAIWSAGPDGGRVAGRAATARCRGPFRGIDTEHDLADRKAGNQLQMPVTVLQQDWGAALGFDAAALWRAWATDLQHRTVSYGQFMAEEAPADIATTLHELLAR